MKTIEELEAELETVTRERDMSLAAWESAGMQGRTAQSAMLELARQLEDAQADVAAAKTALDDVGWLEDERDKARAWAHRAERERDRLREQVVTVNNNIETLQKETWRYKRERDEARAEVERLQQCWQEASDARSTEMAFRMIADRACDKARETIVALTTAKAEADLEIATLTTALDERDLEAERSLEQYDRLTRERDEARAEVERLMHQLADATNESTHFQVMCKREGEEIERLARQVELLTDERDELLVRVANQDAELRATREAYIDAKWTNAYRRGAEAMREACAQQFGESQPASRLWACREAADVIRALPIPEEP